MYQTIRKFLCILRRNNIRRSIGDFNKGFRFPVNLADIRLVAGRLRTSHEKFSVNYINYPSSRREMFFVMVYRPILKFISLVKFFFRD